MALTGKVCLVTGASRGIGKGIAVQLGEAGATVFITGRSSSSSTDVVGGTLKETAEEIDSRGGKGVPVVCDHSKDDQVKAVFDRIKKEEGKLDVLVNNAYSAANAIYEESSAQRKYWQYLGPPGEWWDKVNNVGLRNNYICAVHATQMMVEKGSGLIVNISSFGGLRYTFNVAYGTGKSAIDRMSADMAVELKGTGVSCITLYPGPVLTEMINDKLGSGAANAQMQNIFANGESPEFAGKAVAALAADPQVNRKSGKICLSADLALEYGFQDENGVQPPSIRQLNVILLKSRLSFLSRMIPDWVKLPGFLMNAATNKF